MRTGTIVAACTIWLLSLSANANAQQPVGTVDFPVSCDDRAAALIQEGVAQLHHMMYLNARSRFSEAESVDANCAMALWGLAMTYIHPLWPDRPTEEELSLGAELVARAARVGGGGPREDAYLATTAAYFEDGVNRSEARRLASFEAAWQSAHEQNPEDLEAQAFYALSQLATVDPGDTTYRKQLAAGAMVEEVLERIPDHPGGHHYLIHAYDFPGLAERALPAARNYGVIAPAVPHALHMMSHIFTLRGLWDDSIAWNTKSAAAALQLSEEVGEISIHYLHALDYLVYAHLQQSNHAAARDVVATMEALQPPFGAVNRDAQAYAFAASPARYALERKDWVQATALEPRQPSVFPWESNHDQYVAITHFSRGLGFARLEAFDEASAELAQLEEIRDATAEYSAYWAKQVDIQHLALTGWIAFLEGDREAGFASMEAAARLEGTTQKSPVTPGAVLPAAEQLGEMYLAAGRNGAALSAFEQALSRSPLRLNSLSGAAEALRRSGDPAGARRYYEQIENQSANRDTIGIEATEELK